MTEQQTHLKAAVEQQQELVTDIQNLNTQLTTKREMALKLQGIIEYLNGQGVTIPEEVTEEPEAESSSDE